MINPALSFLSPPRSPGLGEGAGKETEAWKWKTIRSPHPKGKWLKVAFDPKKEKEKPKPTKRFGLGKLVLARLAEGRLKLREWPGTMFLPVWLFSG